MASSNFADDLAFRQQQLAQQKLEAAALSTYRLYRTQLIERGMMALEADKAAREMALQAANTAWQQQMGRAQAVLNAPRGPADWGAYANRLRGLQQSGELPGVLGTLALPGRTAPYSNGGAAPPVPLTNSQMADAATLGLSGGTAAAPQLVGPSWATNLLASAPYQAPAAFPAYYADPKSVPATAPTGAPPYTPPGYGISSPQLGVSSLAAASADPRSLSAQVMPQSYSQAGYGQQMGAADLFGQQAQAPMPTDTWYQQMLNQMVTPDPSQGQPQTSYPPQQQGYGQDQQMAVDEDGNPVMGRGMSRREAHRAQRYGYPQQPQQGYPPQGPQTSFPPQQGVSTQVMPQNYSSPYGTQAAGDMFGLSAAAAPTAAAAATPYGGPVARDPNVRGLYGSDLSYQRFRNLSPTEKDLVTGYAEEGMGGFEPQSKEDFLSGMIQSAPNYAPARAATWAGIR